MGKNKKMIAAISAVVNYIKNEEDQVQAANSVIAAKQSHDGLLSTVKMWGINGRISMMQMRNLMQIKAFHGFK